MLVQKLTRSLRNHHGHHPPILARYLRFHLRMDALLVFCLLQSSCSPSASLVQPRLAFPLSAQRETASCLQTILEIYFQIRGHFSTYEVRHGTSQADLFELERIGKWVLPAQTRPCTAW